MDPNKNFICTIELLFDVNGKLKLVNPNVDCSKCRFYKDTSKDIEDKTPYVD